MFIDQHVQILLENNMILEGVVKQWDNHQVILSALDDSSTSIILHPHEDIRVVKIIGKLTENVKNDLSQTEVKQEPEKETEKNPEIKKSIEELQNKFEEVYKMPSDNELRVKTLAELKSELIKQEKLMIANKLKEHTIGEVKAVKYEQPRFFKKQSSE